MHARSLAGPLLAVLVFASLGACAAGEPIALETAPARGWLHLPQGAPPPLPAVVLVHGTAGPDERYAFHREALLAAGMAVFAVDFKTGVFTGPRDRPRGPTFLPMAFAALRALRQDGRIDPARIAIMGFSLGGHLAMLAADRQLSAPYLADAAGFAAHVGFYPGCRSLLRRYSADLSAAPLLVLTGGADSYGDGTYCPRLQQWMEQNAGVKLALHIYPGVQHAFDKPGMATFADPASDGGRASRAWNGESARDSRQRAVTFLKQAFGLPQGRMQTGHADCTPLTHPAPIR